MPQSTVRISALLPNDFVSELKKFAKENDVSLNYLFKKAVERWFQERLAEDARNLSKMSFSDLPSEDDWINIQPKW